MIYSHIKDDFGDYLENIIYEPETKFWKNTKTGTVYNHDTDLTTKEEFDNRYKSRIENFRQLNASDKAIFYVYNCNNWHIKKIIEAIQLLKKQRPDKISKLIIVSSLRRRISF